MLFNSPGFLFGFLPLLLIACLLAGRIAPRTLPGLLAIASVLFYAAWRLVFVPLLLGSICFNFIIAKAILSARSETAKHQLLLSGVAADLALLGYFKYANFFLSAAHSTFFPGLAALHLDIVLPIGISFFTFTQIAFLVDARRDQVRDLTPTSYLLFTTYFPHLIAGPIIHHRSMLPQFAALRRRAPLALDNLQVGLCMFLIGLFKKTFVADQLSPMAAKIFVGGHAVSAGSAWTGALAYTLQIYYDFSGYCDMACGLSWMFGIRLPINFNSPYKVTSIVDFWRCWHMTLSAFLRDYLYIPLGGNRRGPARRHVNLMTTMLLGGLWHGAGWNFLVWGGLHGSYLIANHVWRTGRRAAPRRGAASPAFAAACWLITFIAVLLAWVPFRAPDLASAMRIYAGMIGGTTGPQLFGSYDFARLAAILGATVMLPNVAELFGASRLLFPKDMVAHPSLWRQDWRPSFGWAALVGMLGGLGLLAMEGTSEFLYFQF